MAATITDKFSTVSTGTRPTTTTVDGIRSVAGGTLSCVDLTGWATDTVVHGVTYQVDGQNNIVAGTQTDFKGIVSGDTITSFTVTGGTDVGNAVGDIVQITPTARWAKDLADGLLVEHNQDGTHTADAAQTIGALLYPVGSIYINASNATNPGSLLGFGTWTAFGAGRVPVGFDATQTEFNTAEKTGGAKTHTLTVSEMPSHKHTDSGHTHAGGSGYQYIMNASGGAVGYANGGSGLNASSTTASGTANLQNTGGDGAHNNLQPYITVYMWKRTA